MRCYTELSFYRVERSQCKAELLKYWILTKKKCVFYPLSGYKSASSWGKHYFERWCEYLSGGVGGDAPWRGGVPWCELHSTRFHKAPNAIVGLLFLIFAHIKNHDYTGNVLKCRQLFFRNKICSRNCCQIGNVTPFYVKQAFDLHSSTWLGTYKVSWSFWLWKFHQCYF